MTRSNPPNFSRQILLLTASIFLLAAPQDALAKHKDHSDDHGGMSSNDSNDDHGDKHSENHKDKNKDHAEKDMNSEKHKGKRKDKESAENGMGSEKHKGKHKDKESAEKDMDSEKHKDKDKYAEKTTDKDKQETPATTADNNASGTGKPGETPTNGGIVPTDSVPGTPAPVAVSGPGAVNTIHPIASPPPHTVTISDGVNTFQIPDGAGGVTVTSSRPGTITVSNGVQTQTLSGIKMTISGALGVGVAKGIQVGRPDAPGSTVIMAPLGTVTGTGVVENIRDGILAVGQGMADGLGWDTSFQATAEDPK